MRSPILLFPLLLILPAGLSALAPRYDEALKLFYGGRYRESLDVIRQVFDDNRGAVELRLLAAQNYTQLGEYENARAHMSFCLKENPDNLACHAMLSRIYRSEKRYDPAIKTAQTALGRLGDRIPLRLELAGAYYAKGNYAAARAHLEKVLQQEPGNFTAIYMDGLIFLKQGRFANAEFRLRNALELKPKTALDLVNLYVNLGFALEREGDRLQGEGRSAEGLRKYSEAARFYHYALRIDSGHPQARENRERMKTKAVH
jgi:tetratricopeptide (TPR) repeat protein